MSEHQHNQPTTVVEPTTSPTPPKAPKPDLSKVKPYQISRNGISKHLSAFAGTRGKWDGVVYQAPQAGFTPDTPVREDKIFLENVEWYGVENVIRIINIFSKRFGQDCWVDAIPEHGDQKGIFQETTFIRSMEALSVASLRISELRELYDEAVQAMQNAQPEFMANMMKAAQIADPAHREVEIKKVGVEFQRLCDAVTSVKAQLEERSQKKSKEVETDTVRAD